MEHTLYERRRLRLKLLIETKFGGRHNALLERLGRSQSQLSQWLSGERNISERSARRIESAAGVEEDWLDRETAAEPSREYTATRHYPIVSSVQAGAFEHAADPYPPGVAEQWLAAIRDAGPYGYYLRVDGQSMTGPSESGFPEGCLVLVDPRRLSPISGEIVVAKLKGDDRVTLKQFVDEDGNRWLRPLNPQYPPLRDHFRILGTVIAMVRATNE